MSREYRYYIVPRDSLGMYGDERGYTREDAEKAMEQMGDDLSGERLVILYAAEVPVALGTPPPVPNAT